MTGVPAQARRQAGGEARLATRATRAAVAAVIAAAFAAVVSDCPTEMLAVPSLANAVQRTSIDMPEIRYQAPSRPTVLIEHTVEKSPYTVPAAAAAVQKAPEPPEVKPAPEPKPEDKKAQKPVKPKPSVKPAVRPKPAVKPRNEPKAPVSAADPDPKQEASETSASAAAGSSVGSTDAGGNSTRNEARMLAEIVRYIEAHKRYPHRARQRGQQGTVVLAIRVGADGTVSDVAVRKKAAAQILNRAALSAAASLKGARVAEAGSELTVDVPVVFSLVP